jgi:hypothetical protein
LNLRDGNSLRFLGGVSHNYEGGSERGVEGEGLSMRSLKLSVPNAFGDLRTGGLARPAAEKFAGAWLACFLVMARGNVLAAFSFEHAFLASVCGIVSAAVAVSLLARRDCSDRHAERERVGA